MLEILKRIFIPLFLFILCVSAFAIRINNFKASNLRSIDELVYYRMGQQLKSNPLDYNTIPYAHDLMAMGRKLPAYFTEPLFKHPPLFSYLIAGSLKIFGNTLLSAEYIPLMASVLMIPMIYLLGLAVFNWQTGLLAAIFLWMDPMNIICSQKIWMETTIAMFSLMAVLFFVLGLKGNGWFFILSGTASGLAANTRYTGILITAALVIFALLYQRHLFLNWKFRLSLMAPLLLLLPWGLWNYAVYGNTLWGGFLNSEWGSLYYKVMRLLPAGTLVTLLIGVLVFLNRKSNSHRSPDKKIVTPQQLFLQKLSFLLVAAFFFVFLKKNFFRALDLTSLPSNSWGMGMFAYEPAFFYLGRLIEFSLVYAFAFIGIFCFQPDEGDDNAAILRLAGFVILIFFMNWGNYQSRYILSSTPFLILLGSNQILRIYQTVSRMDNFIPRLVLKTLFSGLVIDLVTKTMSINFNLSFTNNLCYF